MFWNTLSSWFLGSLTGGKNQNTLQPPKPHTSPKNHSRMREKQNSVFQEYCFAPICNLVAQEQSLTALFHLSML